MSKMVYKKKVKNRIKKKKNKTDKSKIANNDILTLYKTKADDFAEESDQRIHQLSETDGHQYLSY